MKDRIKKFWNKNRNLIVVGGGVVGFLAATFALTKANLASIEAKQKAEWQAKSQLNMLEVENRSLDRENEALYASNVLLNRENDRLRDEVENYINDARMQS